MIDVLSLLKAKKFKGQELNDLFDVVSDNSISPLVQLVSVIHPESANRAIPRIIRSPFKEGSPIYDSFPQELYIETDGLTEDLLRAGNVLCSFVDVEFAKNAIAELNLKEEDIEIYEPVKTVELVANSRDITTYNTMRSTDITLLEGRSSYTSERYRSNQYRIPPKQKKKLIVVKDKPKKKWLTSLSQNFLDTGALFRRNKITGRTVRITLAEAIEREELDYNTYKETIDKYLLGRKKYGYNYTPRQNNLDAMSLEEYLKVVYSDSKNKRYKDIYSEYLSGKYLRAGTLPEGLTQPPKNWKYDKERGGWFPEKITRESTRGRGRGTPRGAARGGRGAPRGKVRK